MVTEMNAIDATQGNVQDPTWLSQGHAMLEVVVEYFE